MSDKVIMVYTVNNSSAFVFNQTRDNMKVIGKWQADPDELFRQGNAVVNRRQGGEIKVSKRGPISTVPE